MRAKRGAWILAAGASPELLQVSPSPQIALLTELYQEYLDDQNSATFVTKVSQRYTVGTLERLASHLDRATRRAAVMAIGFLGDVSSSAVLGGALHDEDRAVRTIAENSIRTVWRRPNNESDRQQLAVLLRLNSSQKYEETLRRATALIDRAPCIAEAWNQRAIAYYNLSRFIESIRDCQQALELNAYHFDAATGMGQCHLQLGNHLAALESFRRAVRLNPSLEGVRAGITYLERTLKKK